MIELKKPAQIAGLRRANSIVAKTIDLVAAAARPGVSLRELDLLAEDFITSQGARPSFKGLYGFGGAICLSLNEICIHGLPDEKILREGDILGIDVGSELGGYYGDAARTIAVGESSPENQALLDCAKGALDLAVGSIRAGMRFKELAQLIGSFITGRGFVPLEGYCGHGIGSRPHCEPEVLNYLEPGMSPKEGPKIKDGMVFCIEPMVCRTSGACVHKAGRWDAAAADGYPSAHFEHCVAIVRGRAEVLSLP